MVTKHLWKLPAILLLSAISVLAGQGIKYDPDTFRVTEYYVSVPTTVWLGLPNTLVNHDAVVQFTITPAALAVSPTFWEYDPIALVTANIITWHGDVIQYDPADPTVANRVTLYQKNIVRADFLGQPNTLVNYDSTVGFTSTATLQRKYWKVSGTVIVDMSAAEQTAVDAEQATADVGQAEVQMVLFDFTTAVTTGDGKYFFHIAEGSKLIGMDLISLTAAVVTVSSSGLPTVDVARCAPVATGNPCSGTVVDVLSTDLTIDVNEDSSFTATTAFAINTANDDVVEDGMWRIDVDIAGTGTQGLIVTLILQLP